MLSLGFERERRHEPCRLAVCLLCLLHRVVAFSTAGSCATLVDVAAVRAWSCQLRLVGARRLHDGLASVRCCSSFIRAQCSRLMPSHDEIRPPGPLLGPK
ncbi:hypothetical protein B0T16DRAFT_412392 [Cercophora newfieldiana]|uniref:Secreted protein n=1 Tax=Cercophora newfieldiana TaxID=92897 RepID=A0AA39Y6N5_9PEZI|nr:hypothetical protein B0T16DRAFT_412392 [Cercophora newfieldiana]